MEKEIKVSINCITYNQVSYIENTIKSFLNQKTNFKFEILIHDDASTDGTSDIIERYSKKYPELIKPIIQKENQYSKGFRRVDYFNGKRANGKYIALCEGDDYWCDEFKLQKQYDYLEKNTNCSMVFSNVKLLDGISNTFVGKTTVKEGVYKAEDIIKKGGDFIPTASIMYRKSAFINPPELYFNASVGDYPMQMIIATKGDVYAFSDEMSVYRVNAKNSWSRKGLDEIGDMEKRVQRNNSTIDLLNDFDEFTNFKYSNELKEVKNEFEFENFIVTNDISIKSLKETEFKDIYEKRYNSAGINQKINLYLNVVSTSKYIKFLKFKVLLKKMKEKLK